MIPVVMSGGSGTRLWPLSRMTMPKQFCELGAASLHLKTLQRLLPLGQPWILGVRSHQYLNEKSLSELNLPKDKIIYEPIGRNTGPAVALLCYEFAKRGFGEEVVGVFPSDHIIENQAEFLDCVKLAEKCAFENPVVTLGIKPTRASTEFGYIELSSRVAIKSTHHVGHFANGFHEKPSLEFAQRFVANGNYVWNSGIFVFKVHQMIRLYEIHWPQLWDELKAMSSLADHRERFASQYGVLPKQSIDFGIMEKLRDWVCIPCEMGWSDMGSWDEVARLTAAGKISSNAKVYKKEAESCFVFPVRNKVYALLGVDDLLVMDTPDALLVTKKNRSQDLKVLIDQMSADSVAAVNEYPNEVRPWGGYEVLKEDRGYKCKVITIDPHCRISYQSHAQRSEHWVIVQGKGEAVLNDKIICVSSGIHIFVPCGAKHRIHNQGDEKLILVEVQLGSYLGEDDIQRFHDDYDRPLSSS